MNATSTALDASLAIGDHCFCFVLIEKQKGASGIERHMWVIQLDMRFVREKLGHLPCQDTTAAC